MEVDLFCADSRIVVELDGAHHFAGADAYRRDRRKDILLQQNRYLVLRFLAEDAGKRLDDVLDTILAALVCQASSIGICDVDKKRGQSRTDLQAIHSITTE